VVGVPDMVARQLRWILQDCIKCKARARAAPDLPAPYIMPPSLLAKASIAGLLTFATFATHGGIVYAVRIALFGSALTTQINTVLMHGSKNRPRLALPARNALLTGRAANSAAMCVFSRVGRTGQILSGVHTTQVMCIKGEIAGDSIQCANSSRPPWSCTHLTL
jgi:hypothetical protein